MIQISSPYRLVSASLSREGEDTLRGHVDAIDAETGIAGWLLDIENPTQKLRLELVVEGVVVAECVTDLPRDDVTTLYGRDGTPGFRLAAAAVAPCLMPEAALDAASIQLRVAGTSAVLSTAHALSLPRQTRREDDTGDGRHTFSSLAARLSALRGDAADLALQPLRPLPEHRAGFVEAFAVDQAGIVWLLGWKRREAVWDGAVVITDRQKFQAGWAFTLFDRPDLDGQYSGFIAALDTDWRPSSASEVHVYFGDQARTFLTTPRPPHIIPVAEFQVQFRQYLSICHTGHTVPLWRLLTRPDSWAVSDAGAGVPVKAALDQVLLLPGFGALVCGWALSPVATIETFALRLGESILECDRASLFFQPRPDLAGAAPGNERLLERAGFTAAFRGRPAGSLQDPVLKLLYEDGTATNHAIDARTIRRLGRATDWDSALVLYPSLTTETFFPDFARTVLRDTRRSLGCVRPHAVMPAERALVFVAPEDRSEVFLLMAELGRYLRACSAPHGIIVIGGTAQSRADAVLMFAECRRIGAVPCSLFLAETTTHALYQLPDVLAQTHTRRFVFVNRGVCLTRSGWSAAMECLDAEDATPAIFEVVDPVSPSVGLRRSAECFAWSADEYAAWLAGAPFLLDGPESCDLLDDKDGARVHHAAAVRTGLRQASRLVRAINTLAG